MLRTLIAIGNQRGKNMDEWDDLIDFVEAPIPEGKDKTPFNNYVAEMVFDIDAQDVYISPELSAFDDRSSKKWRNFKIKPGNNKAVYSCVQISSKLYQFQKTFFGKEEKVEKGEWMQEIEGKKTNLIGSKLYLALAEIVKLWQIFEDKYCEAGGKSENPGEAGKKTVTAKLLLDDLKLSMNDKIVLLSASIKSETLELSKPTPIKDLEGFEEFFIPPKKEKETSTIPKLCYATGVTFPDVAIPEFGGRYSLNKMFVTTTFNYAAHLNSKLFQVNYQVSSGVQTALDRGSDYVLENLKTKIAGVNHCIIPEFLSIDEVPKLTEFTKLQRRCDLLFQSEDWENLTEDIEDDIDSNYWITFQGYQSDGNYFKTTDVIKSVSKHYLARLIEAFRALNNDWKTQEYLPWKEVVAKSKGFNLRSIYGIIPVRKDLVKNQALLFFKALLEKRIISKELLFGFFNELILCYRYSQRLKGYTKDVYYNGNLDFATRDAVFKYLAIFQILKQFKLIKGMENQKLTPDGLESDKVPDFQKSIEQFFTKMEYDDNQKALFYLGRVLSQVAYEQVKKEHSSKPILNKLNFNGLGLKEIERLRLDLTEKTQQYRIHRATEYLFERFNFYFKHNGWSMPPQEALFFLLSGYSFFSSSKKSDSDSSNTNH